MKTYKVITIKKKLFQDFEKYTSEVEETLNEKCNSGWELVDITWVNGYGEREAYLTFRY